MEKAVILSQVDISNLKMHTERLYRAAENTYKIAKQHVPSEALDLLYAYIRDITSTANKIRAIIGEDELKD